MTASTVIEEYGQTSRGETVYRAVLSNGAGLRASVLSYGACIQGIWVPDRYGDEARVTLGFDSVREYERATTYFGATIGRYASRLADGRFSIDGVEYQVLVNDPYGTIHGGPVGFDKRVWAMEKCAESGAGVRLMLRSDDGDQGFPGNLDVSVQITLGETDNRLRMEYTAVTDKPTVVNMTNHSYFNLSGEGSGSILGNLLTVNASRYVPVTSRLVPQGPFAQVHGTPFDFREPHVIGERVRDGNEQLRLGLGYDHNFVIDGYDPDSLEPRFAAKVHDPVSGRSLEVWTSEPGLDVYAGNQLDGSIIGAGGRIYRQSDAIALEPEHFTDSPNNPDYPSTVLRPGGEYRSVSEFRFTVE